MKKPALKRFKLTDTIRTQIVAFVRAGGFAHVAAEAAGIPASVFAEWMERGNPDLAHDKPWRRKSPYEKLYIEVMQASAQARLSAEIKTLQENPDLWLKGGPGKDRPEFPGWSTTVKPVVHQHNQSINLLLHPELQGMFASILQVLLPFPEARAKVAEALAGPRAQARLERTTVGRTGLVEEGAGSDNTPGDR